MLDALAVGTVCSVDGNDVALVDEEGNHDLGTGLEGNFLQCGGRGGIALYCRLGIGNLEGHIGRKFAGEAALFVGHEHHLHMLAFLHKVGILHNIVREMNLLVSLFVHEVESVLIAIKELVGAALHVDGLDLCTGGESIFKDAAVFEITEFGLDESGALAGFDMLEPYDHARLTIVIQIEAVFEISCCCHISIN